MVWLAMVQPRCRRNPRWRHPCHLRWMTPSTQQDVLRHLHPWSQWGQCHSDLAPPLQPWRHCRPSPGRGMEEGGVKKKEEDPPEASTSIYSERKTTMEEDSLSTQEGAVSAVPTTIGEVQEGDDPSLSCSWISTSWKVWITWSGHRCPSKQNTIYHCQSQ